MKKNSLLGIGAKSVLVSACGLVHGGTVPVQTLRAGSAHDVIADINIATRSRLPTIIRVAPGRYVFDSTTFASAYDPSRLPVIDTSIEIVGSGASITSFEGSTEDFGYRLFTVLRSGSLRLSRLTLKNGTEECTGACSKLGGGALLNAGGQVRFDDCVLSGNAAFNTDGSDVGGGGAILNLNGTLTLNRTQVTGNGALARGGGISLLGGSASIWDSTISGNSASFGIGHATGAWGAGIYVGPQAKLSVLRSTISGNVTGDGFATYDHPGFGAGIYNGGTAVLIDSAILENATTGNPGIGYGGGIANQGTMTIVNVTVGGNQTGGRGGGIYNTGRLTLQGLKIRDNSAAGAYDIYYGVPFGCSYESPEKCYGSGGGIWNEPGASLTMATTAVGSSSPDDCEGTLSSKGHNALSDITSCTVVASAWLGGRPTNDRLGVDLKLGELQENGVPGFAHYAPLPGSPLIDGGGAIGPTCADTDQLGNHRVAGDGQKGKYSICDIGAIEFIPPVH
jgi:hypothetical protein